MRGRLVRSVAAHVVIAGLLVLGVPAAAQTVLSSPAVHGIWNPVVGAGSVYEMQYKPGQTREMQIAVVGEETVDGQSGYWLQVLTKEPRSGEPLVAESLLVKDGDRTELRRMVVQQAGKPAMELPAAMTKRSPAGVDDVRKEGERVGTEEITTPAGTFTCEHYRSKDGSVDVWVSDKVSPWGLVQMRGRGNMTLIRLVSGATSKITGTPQQIDASKLIRRGQPPPTR